MLAILKEIILDNQVVTDREFYTRELKIQTIEQKATIIMGVRRSGKSTYLQQCILELRARGISPENNLLLNFVDDRLHGLNHTNLHLILEAYFSIYPEKKNKEKIYCFFDEIQMIEQWEIFIERLMRTENCEVYITGSSAKMLSKEIATQMRGRALAWEIFPFSFTEFLHLNNISYNKTPTTQNRLMIQQAFDKYYLSGGFPEVMGQEQKVRIKIHQEYFTAILFRDLIERHDISHPKAIIDLAHRLIDNIASLYSINNLSGYLKSLGHTTNKATVSNYLEWMEDAYIFFTVKLFDASLARANVNSKKIYCIDHAMIKSISSGILINSGHILENIVFVALRRKTENIYYYRTRAGHEVDFIIVDSHTRNHRLIQVCETLNNPETRRRETRSITDAMREMRHATSVIVTRNERESIQTQSGVIEVIPLWQFLIDQRHDQ